MLNRTLYALLLTLLLSAPLAVAAPSDEQPIDLALAQKYFREAEAACARDMGRLWGRPLCGPMIFFEPRTRALVANRPDAEGRLRKSGELFLGRLPESENAANTATNWAGVRWSMIFWWHLAADDPYERARLMLHESFHRVQDELGLPMTNPSNDHLDSLEGRVWLQLEWRALVRALTQTGDSRRAAAADALVFRLHRRSLFPQAEGEERGLEMNEGVAEYTGVRLSGRTDAELREYLAARVAKANQRQSFTRSFAYESGPLYGLLLDESGARWRARLKPTDDLGTLLMKALSLKLPADVKGEALKRSAKYDGEALRTSETARERARRERLAAYRSRLVDGPVLLLPLTDALNYSFDPNSLVPLEGAGTVYPTLRVTDAWGVLEVKGGGALMVREDGKPVRLYVTAPGDRTTRPPQGDGWTLQPNEGWTLEQGERKGDYVLTRQK